MKRGSKMVGCCALILPAEASNKSPKRKGERLTSRDRPSARIRSQTQPLRAAEVDLLLRTPREVPGAIHAARRRSQSRSVLTAVVVLNQLCRPPNLHTDQ